MLTWDDFNSGRIAYGAQTPTEHSLRLLYEHFKPDLIGGYVKWGMPFIKDLVVMFAISECKDVVANSEGVINAGVRAFLTSVDWDIINKVFSDGSETFNNIEVSDNYIGVFDQIYQDDSSLPSVTKNPGHLYDSMFN